jgi:hypothetical protein
MVCECDSGWGDEKCVQNFCGKPTEKHPLERLERRWKDNIGMKLTETKDGR